jgi:hypothetical protein
MLLGMKTERTLRRRQQRLLAQRAAALRRTASIEGELDVVADLLETVSAGDVMAIRPTFLADCSTLRVLGGLGRRRKRLR